MNYKKEAGFSFLLAIIVIAIIAIGASVYWKSGQVPVTPIPVPVTSDNSFKTLPTPTATDETADWKTYKNDKYGFEFKYPEIWSIQREVDDDGTTNQLYFIQIGPSPKSDGNSNDGVSEYNSSWSIQVLKNNDSAKLSVRNMVTSNITNAGISSANYYSFEHGDLFISLNADGLNSELLPKFAQTFRFTK
ncbi:hypothetical protein IT398_01495 [Candidatus Nomurabacteria bacterium]|nr:hypothetical protein [Candidatus Nomurabacteria bacterium]